MAGEITSEQLPELLEQANQVIMGFDAYLRQILIELKSAPNTPKFQRLRDIATKKLHLTEQWKIIYGNEDAWRRQKVYVAQVTLGFLRQPDFEFTDAVRAISDAMSRGEAEAKQQTLAAATQVAMGMPYFYAQFTGADSMWKLVFGSDMFGKELSGWERVQAAGEVALMAAMIYIPAKITSELSAPKTTTRIGDMPGAVKPGTATGKGPTVSADRTEIDPLGRAAMAGPTEVEPKMNLLPVAEQRAGTLSVRADEIEVRMAEARSRGVDVDGIAEKHGIDASKPIEDQLKARSDIKQEMVTDALSEDLLKATQAKIDEGVGKGETLVVRDGEPDTDLIHKALVRQQAAERAPAEMTLEDYKTTQAELRERMKDPKFREKLDRGVLLEEDVGETSYRLLLDGADRAMIQRMAGGEVPARTPAPVEDHAPRTPVIPAPGGVQQEPKERLVIQRESATMLRKEIAEAKQLLSETVGKLKNSEQERYEGQGAPNAEQTEHELFLEGQKIRTYIDKKERELGATEKSIKELEQAPHEEYAETNVEVPVLPPAEVFTRRPVETTKEQIPKKPEKPARYRWFFIVTGVLVLIVIVVLSLWLGGVFDGSKGGVVVSTTTTTAAVTESTVTTQPTESSVTTQPTDSTSTTQPSGTSAPPIPPEPTAFSGEGTFSGEMNATGGNLSHENFGLLAGVRAILAALRAEQPNTIVFNSEVPKWIPVTGGLAADGSFTATGTGIYAGYPNIDVTFKGNITFRALEGDYTVGAAGGLPGGQPIIYHFQGSRTDAPPQELPVFMSEFITEFVGAKQTADQTWLFDHLHPATIKLYGADQSKSALAAEVADPSYQIKVTGASGPAPWVYSPDAGTVTVPDVYTVNGDLTEQGKTVAAALHFGWVDGQLYWFANFGELAPPAS